MLLVKKINSMNIILSHPTGNANVRAAALGLVNENMLTAFHTSIASFPGNIFDNLSKINFLSEFKRRAFDPLLQPVTHMHPLFESCRIISGKVGLQNLIRHETGFFSIDAVYNQLDRKVSKKIICLKKKGLQGVYAYEDGAVESFKMGKKLGLKCYYDLPIGYWKVSRQLLSKEQEKWPEWAATLTGLMDSDKKLAQKDEELLLADRIFVASSFTAKSLQNFSEKLATIEIIPYGFPVVAAKREYLKLKQRPLKILFVGGLSQRKGIAELFAAVNTFGKNIALTIVGKKVTMDCAALDTQLSKHKWIPSLPHHEILLLMREHDVLAFPSLFEGFGLVITEAMSQGTPVITTERTAGPDLINHGENGWLIEAGSTASLKAVIDELLSKPEIIINCGKAAIETARARPWEKYGAELARAISSSVSS